MNSRIHKSLKIPLLPPACIPALILAVSLAVGCLAGRPDTGLPFHVALPAGSGAVLAALLCPNPITVAAAGLLAGSIVEGARHSREETCMGLFIPETTLRGVVTRTRPGTHGSVQVTLDVSELLTTEKIPVCFPATFSMPASMAAGSVTDGLPESGNTVTVRSALGMGVNSLMSGQGGAAHWKGESDQGGVVAAARRRLAGAIDQSESPMAGLLASMALGERWRVHSQVRDLLRRSGTYHLLAVSGVHIAAAILFPSLVLRMCCAMFGVSMVGWSRMALLVVSAGAALFYLSFTGSSPSAIRAFLFLLLFHLAAASGRQRLPLALLAWCAVLIIAFSPASQPDLALVMSVLAVTGILAASQAKGGRCEKGHWRAGAGEHGRGAGPGPWAGKAWRQAWGVVLGAAIFTMPVVAWCASGISLVGPVANFLLSIPFGLILIPWAVMLDILALCPWVDLERMVRSWETAAGFVMAAADLITSFPLSFIPLSWTGRAAATLSAVGAAWIWGRAGWGIRRGALLFLTIGCISGTIHYVDEMVRGRDLTVFFPSLGQADGSVLRVKGQTVLIDCGPPGSPGRPAPMAGALEKLGIRRVDALFISHPHPDHGGGLGEIAARWPIDRVFLAGDHRNLGDWETVLEAVPVNTPVRLLLAGDKVCLGELEFRTLGPRDGAALSADPNGGSMILLVTGDRFRGLFTGDAPWSLVAGALPGVGELDLFKVPHHGSATGFAGSGMEEVIESMRVSGNTTDSTWGGRTRFLCPSRTPGQGTLPSRKVVKWFASRGIQFIYPEYPGITLRYLKDRPTKFSRPHFGCRLPLMTP
ncbi:MAG: ComEC/Rec2 family competence protein [bacterium]|nr:ComEC/Rec2 family competence protein [bacterium]